MILLLTVPLLIFAYHYLRNGWFFGRPWFQGHFKSRLAWSLSFAVAYLLTAGLASSLSIFVYFVIMSYAAILVPHGYAMDMGRWSTFESKWPSFFIKVSQEKWEVMSPLRREAIDALQLACVGLVRGVLVFLPLALKVSTTSLVSAVSVVAIGHPVAYWIGWRVPLKALNNEKNSAEWGEFLLAISWAVALFVLFGG